MVLSLTPRLNDLLMRRRLAADRPIARASLAIRFHFDPASLHAVHLTTTLVNYLASKYLVNICIFQYFTGNCKTWFLQAGLAKLSVRDARVHTCKRVRCTVHDKLSCTRLENYTIGACVSVSVSVSV